MFSGAIDEALLYGVFFILAAAADWLSCLWHYARESGSRARGMLLAMLLEGLGWLPIWFAITLEDPLVAVVSIIGSAVGSAVGFEKKVSERPVQGVLLHGDMAEPVSDSWIEDGFGSCWSITCPECNRQSMRVVRPGKAQCGNCG